MKPAYEKMLRQLRQWTETAAFPVISTDKYCDYYTMYPNFHDAPATELGVQEVPLSLIHGDNWAFQDANERGAYPRHIKLENLLRGYMGQPEEWERGKSIPPVTLVKIDGRYYLSEGNHRYYLSVVLERPTLLAEVTEYDYASYVQDSVLVQDSWQHRIVYHGMAWDVTPRQAEYYLQYKMRIMADREERGE